MKKWYTVKAEGTKARIELRGIIGTQKAFTSPWTGELVQTGGAGTLQEFADEMKALGNVSEVDLRISSEGGNAFDGIAIHNILAGMNARIVATVEGFAWSAASVVLMAADEIVMAPSGILMIHDAEYWTCEPMDIEGLDEVRSMLDSTNRAMALAYQGKAGGTVDEWLAEMGRTLWLNGDEAKARGLVDKLSADVALSAYVPSSLVTARYKMPDNFSPKSNVQNKGDETPSEPILDMDKTEVTALIAEALQAQTEAHNAKIAELEAKLVSAAEATTAAATKAAEAATAAQAAQAKADHSEKMLALGIAPATAAASKTEEAPIIPPNKPATASQAMASWAVFTK